MKLIEIEHVHEIRDGIQYLTLRISHLDDSYYLTVQQSKTGEVTLLSETISIWDNTKKEYVYKHIDQEIQEEITSFLTEEFEKMPKEKTTHEIREAFLQHIWVLIDVWFEQEHSERERMEGLAFSILSMLDGCSADLPGFIVAPCPLEEDMKYHIENGEDYYPYNDIDAIKGDIAGSLHELFHTIRKK